MAGQMTGKAWIAMHRAHGYVSTREAAQILGVVVGSNLFRFLGARIANPSIYQFNGSGAKRGLFMWPRTAVERIAAEKKAAAAQPPLPVAAKGNGNGAAHGETGSTATLLQQALLVSGRVRDVETRLAALTERVEKLTAALGGL